MGCTVDVDNFVMAQVLEHLGSGGLTMSPHVQKGNGSSGEANMDSQGQRVHPSDGSKRSFMRRMFWITNEMLETHEHIDGCRGRDVAIFGFDHRGQVQDCRGTFE